MNDWRTYDLVADAYERVHAPRFVEPARDLVAIANPPAGGRVLDLGTGTGVAAEAALESVGPEGLVVGVDGSTRMLEVARRVRPGLLLASAEAIDLPFSNSTFDAVLGNFVLAHFRKVQTALYDAIRVLRPGGRLAMSAWSDAPDTFQTAFLELVENVVPRELLEPAWADVIPGHERFRSRAAIEQAFADAGLRHVRTEPRRYRWVYTLDDYLDGLEVFATGRFVRSMLGEQGWTSFRERVRATFAERFADPLNDVRDVILAVGTKV
jgi:ubiquinone/menaquinone biosynthesis C-methylase UbiE